MAEEEEDPFGSLTINLCQPISSDILKFQVCPLLLESPSMDPVSDLEQTLPLTQTPFEPVTEIHPPGSDRDEDTPSVAPLANNELHAPPKHHNRRSFSSSQEFLSQREKPAVNSVIHDHVLQTSRVDDDIQLEGGENLHFPERCNRMGVMGIWELTPATVGSDAGPKERMDEKSVEENRVEPCSMDSLDFAEGKFVGCLKDTTNEGMCVTNVDSTAIVVDKLGEISKIICVSKEDRDCDTLCAGQAGIDHQVDCTEGSVLDKGQVIAHEDSSAKDICRNSANGQLNVVAGQTSVYVGSDAGPEERMDEKAVEEDRVGPCSKDNLDFVPGKSVGCFKDINNQGICVTSADSIAMDLEDIGGVNIEERLDKKTVAEDRVDPCSVGNLDSVPGKSVGGNRNSNEGTSMTNLDSMEENGGIKNVIATLDCEIKGVEGTKELIHCGSDGVIVYNEKKVDETCMMNSVNLSIKASIKGVNTEEKPLKQKDGESCSGSKNTKEIESFRYEGCSSDKRYLAKEVISWGRRDLPLSISGKDNEPTNLKVKKRSWKELMEVFEVYFKRDDSFEDVDFLETAKRRGLTFP